MKKIFALFLPILAVISLLAGCVSPKPTAAPLPAKTAVVNTPTTAPEPTQSQSSGKIAVTDALGRTVEFTDYPSHILIVGKAAFMLLDAAFLFPQAQERIIGYELRSQTGVDFVHEVFPAASSMTVLAMDAGPEQIAPLNPDLVMMKSNLKDSLGNQVEQLGVPVIYLDLESPEKIDTDLQTLGQVFGDSARADQLVGMFDQAKTKVTDLTANLKDDEKPSVLLAQYSNKGGAVAFSTPPTSFLQTRLVEMAGGTPVWGNVTTDGWTVVTLEQIAAWNPAVIILVDYKGNAIEVVEGLKADANWKLLDAVKNGQLYAFPLDFQSWDQPDTRWTLGLTWLAIRLHPELFPTVNMLEEVKAFYANFYGLSERVISEKVLPLVKGDFINQP